MKIEEISPPLPPALTPEGETVETGITTVALDVLVRPCVAVTGTLGSWLFTLLSYVPGNQTVSYHASLMWRQIDHSQSPDTKPWWNEINKHLFLGALPLSNWDHHVQLSRQVQAVLSMNEEYELESSGLFSEPVRQEQWHKSDITFMQIPTPDFMPPSLENIERAVSFIHEQIGQEKKVYVHCKAGRGRSAIVVICYLIRYEGKSLLDAWNMVKRKRPQINLNASQEQAIKDYVQTYCQSA